MLWTKVIGQKILKNKLKYLIDTNQVPHSQLFTGASGYGSLPLVIEFSLSLLENNSVSKVTRKLSERCQHPDLHFILPVVKKNNENVVYSHHYIQDWLTFIDTKLYGSYSEWFESINVGNRQGSISIADIENVRKKISLKAFNGGARVCIVWGAEKMNNQASNAFLKILEEPPKNTFFLLIAENQEEVLPTIVSRCQITNLGPIDDSSLMDAIKKKTDNPESLVVKAQGNYNDLLDLITNDQDKEHETLLIEGLRKAFKVNKNKKLIIELMSWSASLCKFGKEEQKTFLKFGIQFFRDAYLLNYSLDDIISFQSKTNFDLSKIAPYINDKNINELVSLFEQTHYNLTRNGNVKMLFVNLALRLSELIYLGVK